MNKLSTGVSTMKQADIKKHNRKIKVQQAKIRKLCP